MQTAWRFKMQIPERQAFAPRSTDAGHVNVACRTGHWTSATRQCPFIHLKDMSIVVKTLHLRINVRGLLSRCSKPTIRPYSTHPLLRTCTPYHSPPVNSSRGIATKAPSTDHLFEEERLPNYGADQFYPVSIGKTINSRYHVIGKLGYGANSTAWFCRDLS